MLKKNSRVDSFVLYKYRYGICMAVLVFATVFLLSYQLVGLVPGISQPEAAQGISSVSLRSILENPIYAPFKAMQWVFIKLLGQTTLALRLPSIILGAASVAILYDVFRHWHKQRIAILGSLFFVTSSWFLHSARLGVASITLVFFVVALLWAATKLHHAPVRRWPFLIMATIVALSLYVPFMLYFLIAGVVLHRFAVKKYLWHLNKKERILGVVILLIVVAPLVYAFINNPDLIRTYFGIPQSLPSISQYLKNIPNTIGYVFWKSVPSAVFHLGDLPMLDIFTATMAALGVYQYEKQMNQHRTKWLFIGTFILILTLSIGANVANFAVLTPLIYIFAATGVVALLVQWYEIFPKNPVARTVGLLPIIFLFLVVTMYHSNRYFIAWARAPETRQAFNMDTIAIRDAIIKNGDKRVIVVAPDEHHVTLRYSLGDVADSVIIYNENEFNKSNVAADATYVHSMSKIAKDKKKELKFEGYVTTDREYNSVAYLRYSGPNSKISA